MSGVVSRGVRMRAARVHLSSGAVIDAQVPATPQEMSQGLRGRAAPTPMLFIFDAELRHAMTMTGVSFPLDMVFISRQGLVVDVICDVPVQEPIVRPAVAARYCLELPARWAAGMGIGVGDRVMITPMVRSR